MDTVPDDAIEESATAEFWRAVRYIVRWANGESVEVEQPPLTRAPDEYRTAA